MSNKPKLLLHVCCAPCATYPIKLLQEEYEVELLFYNSNIQPEEEYRARLKEARQYAHKLGVKLHELDYDADMWFRAVRGLESEPEGGCRCEVCYRIRLGRTARFAVAGGFDKFTTTLSISPHKDTRAINKIGRMIGGMYMLDFYAADFKKNDGFKKSTQMSEESGLYRQNYCGCVYSKKNKKK